QTLAADPTRYQALQQASQCFADIKTSDSAVADASASPTPTPVALTQNSGAPTVTPTPAGVTNATGGQVPVPDLSLFDTTADMKATLASVGLSPAFISSKEAPPLKEKEFKFASQSPEADAMVARGSTVTVSIYPKYEGGKVPNVIGLNQ